MADAASSQATSLFERAQAQALELAKTHPLKDTPNEMHERDLAVLIYALSQCHSHGMSLPRTLGWIGRTWAMMDEAVVHAVLAAAAAKRQEEILRTMPVDPGKMS